MAGLLSVPGGMALMVGAGVVGDIAVVAGIGCVALICIFWLWSAVLAQRVGRTMPFLADVVVPAPVRWPSLSVISPACNEAATLRDATLARLRSDYPDFELILVDDRSTDGTGAIADELARTDARLKVLHLRELPEGWLGKVNAMEKGLAVSRGEWVLLSDADVHVAPDALRRAVALAEARGLDHLVVLPRLWSGGFLRDAAIAAFGRLFTLSARTWAVSDPDSDAAVGVGAFNLVRRTALEKIGGLRTLRLAVADDMELGRRLKRSGARQAAANGRGMVELDWYPDLLGLARGVEKGLFAEARCEVARLIIAALVMLVLDGAPWVALFSGIAWLAVLGGAALITGLIVNACMARWAGMAVLPSLLMPLGTVLLAWIMVRAGVVGWRRGGVLWRGTLYPSALLREAMAWGKEGWRGDRPRQ